MDDHDRHRLTAEVVPIVRESALQPVITSLPPRDLIPESVLKELEQKDYFKARLEALRLGQRDLAKNVDDHLRDQLIYSKPLEIKSLPQETLTHEKAGDAIVDEHFRPGSTESYLGKVLTDDGEVISGIFKPKGDSYFSSIEAELTAYEIERSMGLGIVPVTVEREFEINGKKVKGSFQYWVRHYKEELKAKNPMTNFFDSLIGNNDRTNNMLRGPVAIDHGYSSKFNQNLLVDLPPKEVAEVFLNISEAEYRSLLFRLPPATIDQALKRRREIFFLLSHPELKISGRMGLAGAIGFGGPNTYHSLSFAVRKKALSELMRLDLDYLEAEKMALKTLEAGESL